MGRGNSMKNTNIPALDPFGRALMAYWRGNRSAVLHHEFRSGRTLALPVSVFFRDVEDFFPTDKAMAYCRGRVLVVGAGTGVHALVLERQGHDVTAVEVNSQAVRIMKERGIRDVRQEDFFEFKGESYDTVLILGHNIGMCETLDGIKKLLGRCALLLNPGGRVLVNSVEEPSSPGPGGNDGYPGELEFRLSHGGETGPWMRWLHVDIDTLTSHALSCGWTVEKRISAEDGGFLAKLELDTPHP